jgi:G:T-mismatch repair DNA endonuclease (very short patch repair protein)
LVLKEKEQGKRIMLGRNGKEHHLPELPDIRVDGFCEETRTVYEFNGCHWHGHTCMPFRDLPMACGGGTLAERYEQTMFRLERITKAGSRCNGNVSLSSLKLWTWKKYACP